MSANFNSFRHFVALASGLALLALLLGACASVEPLQPRLAPRQAPTGRPGDAYGDALPVQARARLGTARLLADGPVEALRFIPARTALLSVGVGGAALWDLRSGLPIQRWSGRAPEGGVAVSPGGSTMALADGDGVRLVQMDDLPTPSLDDPSLLTSAPSFSPKGRALAGGGPDHKVRIWKLEGRSLALTLEGHQAPITATAYSSDSQRLASGDAQGAVHLWGAQDGAPAGRILAGGEVTALAWASEQLLVAVGGAVTLRATPSGTPLATFETGLERISRLEVSEDGLLLCSGQGVAELWSMERRQRLKVAAEPGPAALAEDGRAWASAHGGLIQLQIVATDQELLVLDRHTEAISGGAVAGSVALTVGQDGTSRLWDAATGRQLGSWPAAAAALTPDGLSAAVAGGGGLRLLDTSTGAERWSQGRAGGLIEALAFSPDGETLAGLVRGRGAVLWDALTGAELRTIPELEGAGPALVFSPDGATLAASFQSTIRLHRAEDGAQLRVLAGPHQHHVEALAFSPDGRRLASGAVGDQEVALWSVALGSAQRALATPGGARSLAFSRDGATLAVGGADGALALWDVAGGRRLARFQAHRGALGALGFTPDGLGVMTAGADTRAMIWELARIEPRGFFALPGQTPGPMPPGAAARLGSTNLHHDAGVTMVASALGGAALVTAAVDGSLRLWDADDGDLRAELTGHQGELTAMAVSPDGASLVGADEGGVVHRWALAEARHAGTFQEVRLGRVGALAFDKDGRRLAAGGEGGRILVLQVASGRPLLELKFHQKAVTSLSFSPHKNRLASASLDGAVVVWSLTSGDPMLWYKGFAGGALSVAWSPGKRWLAIGGADQRVQVMDMVTGAEVAQWVTYGPVQWAQFSSSGLELLTAGAGSVARWSAEVGVELWRRPLPLATRVGASIAPDGRLMAVAAEEHGVRFMEVDTGREEVVVGGHLQPVTAVARDPEGRWLATGGADRAVVIWEQASGQARHILRGHEGTVLDLAFSPSTSQVASASADGTVRTWSLDDGAPQRTMALHQGPVNAVIYTLDGRSLVSAGADGALVLANAATGFELARLGQGAGGQAITAMVLDPTEERIYFGASDGTLRGWSTRSYKVEAELRGHTRPITHLAIHVGRKLLASVDDQGQLMIWDLRVRRLLRAIPVGPVEALAFAPDGTTLATLDGAGAHVWEVDTGAEQIQIAPRVGRFTDVIFAPDGQSLLTASTDTTVLVWPLEGAVRFGELMRARAVRGVAVAEASGAVDRGLILGLSEAESAPEAPSPPVEAPGEGAPPADPPQPPSPSEASPAPEEAPPVDAAQPAATP